ncbi:mitogen-activated protein kinase kinase kinase 5 [Wolffia australiana]
MPWWKGRSRSDSFRSPRAASSSPQCSSSSAPSPRRSRLEFAWPWRESPGNQLPKSARPGKLRQLEIADGDDGLVSRSASSLESSPALATAAPPRPLPLPLPSPPESSSSPLAERRGHRTSADYVNLWTAIAEKGGKIKDAEDTVTFRVNAPPRSAPTSGFSSPVLSPRRMSSGDFFSLRCPAANWSGGEAPFSGDSALISLSPDQSPRLSPTMRSPGARSRNPSGPSSPLHPIDGKDGAAVHPLPLPPGGAAYPPPNQWQKGKLIGSGTFGSVYVATNRHTGALCAMKEVSLVSDDPKSSESIKQLEQEIKVLSQLKHQNIVQYYGSEVIGDRFYIFLEYVYPGSINKYVREHFGAITESVVRNFTRHILNGLAYLHSKKTMHRDIKGANLLVDSSGVVKLADFGMAKHLTGEKAVLSLKGTSYWMAPEVVQAMLNKDRGYDLSVDIWSLGCTIIEMFTGKHPWDGFEGAAAMFKVLRDSPRIPEALSAEGKDFLRCCFRRNPAERPTAAQLLDHSFVKNLHHHDSPAPSLSSVSTVVDLPPETRRSKSDREGRKPKTQDGQSGWSKSQAPALTGWDPRLSPRSTLQTVLRLSPPRIAQIPLGPLARRRTADKEAALFSPREQDLQV